MVIRGFPFFKTSKLSVLRQLEYKSLYEGFAPTELSREVLQKGEDDVQLLGFEFHWKINIDQTDGIYYNVIFNDYSSGAASKSSL